MKQTNKFADDFNVSLLSGKWDTIKTNVESEFKLLVNKKDFAEKIVNNPLKSSQNFPKHPINCDSSTGR